MKYLRRVGVGALAAVVGFVGVTLVALEGREVVVVRTFDEHGIARETRTWIADEDGSMWVEAANASRPFLAHIRVQPHIELRRGGTVRQCEGLAVANPEGHRRIRRLLAAKYGWADRWIGLLTDTSGSLAVRINCR